MTRSRVRTALTAATAVLVLFAPACGSDDASSSNVDNRRVEAALARYRSTLQEEAAHLVAKTEAIATQVEDDELEKAQSRYSMARVRYSQLEPLVDEVLADMDRRIDSYPDEVPSSRFGGFHRVERGLFDDETVEGVMPVARVLLADVEELRRELRTVPLKPEQIATAVAGSLSELPASMLAGAEEPYADNDMVDVAANVEGAEAAFAAIKPMLIEESELVDEIEAQLAKAYAQLDEFGTLARDPEQIRSAAPGTSFVVYSQVPQPELRKQAESIETLADQLSQAAASIG